MYIYMCMCICSNIHINMRSNFQWSYSLDDEVIVGGFYFNLHTDITDAVAGIEAGFHRELALVIVNAVETPE